MRVRFITDHLLPTSPGMVRDFRAGWEGDLAPDLADAAVAAGVAETVAPNPAPEPEDEDGA